MLNVRSWMLDVRVSSIFSPIRRSVLLWIAFTSLVSAPLALAAPVAVDSTDQGPMTGFDLFENGLFWWNNGNFASELEPARTGKIGIRSLEAGRWLVSSGSRTHLAKQSTALRAPRQSVGRTSTHLFYFELSGTRLEIVRRPVFGGDADEIDFSGASYNEVGSILVHGPNVYWTVRGGAASPNGELRAKSLSGGPGGGDVILGSGIGTIIKMKAVTIVNTSGDVESEYVYMLNTVGELWRVRLPNFFNPFFGPISFFASNVTDFDARHESVLEFEPPFFLTRYHLTRLYAATGVNLSDSRTSGKLIAFDLTRGGSYTEYNSDNPNVQVTGVAVDPEHIFVTSTPLRFVDSGQFSAWIYDLGNSTLVRRIAPAHSDFTSNQYQPIAFFQEGRNLRSDTQWLYWAHQNQIRKIRTDVPGLALDYRAVGVEAVQAVQDFNNSVPLVAGKPTLVRGYAQMVQNTTGYPKFRMAARLQAYRNGIRLVGEAYASNQPIVDGAADLPTLRSSLDRSFLFDLPLHWLDQPGPLQLHMMVNSSGTAPEIGDAPFANNTAITTVNVAPARTPCLVFKTLSASTSDYDPLAPNSGFGDIVDRALTLMPASGFQLRFSPGTVTKPVATLFGVKQRSFSMPDDDWWALMWMTMAHAFSRDPAPDSHWVGMLPADIGTWNGIGGVRGVKLSDYADISVGTFSLDFSFPSTALEKTSVIRMNAGQGTGSGAWNSVGGGHTLAHELGHNYGRFHINQTTSPSGCMGNFPKRPWHLFPGDPCTLGPIDLNLTSAPIGFDPRTASLVLPNMAGDTMTYANSSWVSPFTWNALLGAIPVFAPPGGGGGGGGFSPEGGQDVELNPQPLPPHGSIYMVHGLIDPVAQNVTLLPVFRLPAGTLDPAKVQESLDAAAAIPPSAPYRLRLLNGSENVLDERPILPLASGEGEGSPLGFVQAVPNVPGSVTIQVMHGTTVLDEISASPNAPSLVLDPPGYDPATQTLALDWAASDTDGDVLLFTVQFSSDDGTSWETLRINDPALGFATSTRLLPGSTACRLRVMATDGFRTTLQSTPPFALPNRGPIITLSGLRNGQRIPFNSPEPVRAFAYDAENGALDSANTYWTASGPELRNAFGPALSLKGLAPGTYAVTAYAEDLDGQPESASMSIEILPIEVADGTAPVIDGLGTEDSYLVGEEVRLKADQSSPSARFVHAAGSLYVCIDGLRYSEPNAFPADVNFYININGTPTATPQSDDVGFGVDENGVPARARGNGTSWFSEIPDTFDVKTMRGTDSWSAEFRIPESALGGWNRQVGLVFFFGHSFCITLPGGECISAGARSLWPTQGNVLNPSTWTELVLGRLPEMSNRAPVAVAHAPGVVSFTDPETVSLNGSGSYDPDGDALTYAWTQIAGPSVSILGANHAVASFETPELTSTATLTFRLVVHDGVQSSAPSTVNVILVPAALPGPSGSGGNAPVTVHVGDGSATIQLDWPGTPGALAIIQASTDLKLWENIATNQPNYLGVLLHTDAAAGIHPRRFYRAISAPVTRSSTRAELAFDGLDDYVEVANHPSFNALPLTITTWFRTRQSTGTYPGIVANFNWSTATGFAIALDQGCLTAWYQPFAGSYLWDFGAPAGMPFVADGQWHHVALVAETTGGRLYLDGSLVRTMLWSGPPQAISTTAPLRLGRYPGISGLYFQGAIDETALWNRALSATEIAKMIPGKLSGTETGLLGFWPLDEGTGDQTADASGRGREGLLRNGTAWMESTAPLRPNPTAGGALHLNGVDQAVQVSHQNALNAFPLTVAGWVKTAEVSLGYVAVANKYVGGSGNGYSLHIHNGHIAAWYFRGDGHSYVYTADPGLDGGFIADGQWHHVAYVVDAAGARIFVDGAQTGSLGWTGNPGVCTTPTPLQFGPYPLGDVLDGRLDEISLWNRALDATEINAVMSFKLDGHESGLLGYWPLDNGTGTTATDASASGYHGTLQNTPIWVSSDAPVSP